MKPHELKMARHQLGLSVNELAEALSDPDGDSTPVNPRTIRRWEKGPQDISSPAIAAIYLMLDNQ